MLASGAPGLLRAVADCTQTPGPGQNASSSLQAYLADPSCVDAVYRALLHRACAQPRSDAVLARCISLMQEHVHRYRPSLATLHSIGSTCRQLARDLGPEAATLSASLRFLQLSVARPVTDVPTPSTPVGAGGAGAPGRSPHSANTRYAAPPAASAAAASPASSSSVASTPSEGGALASDADPWWGLRLPGGADEPTARLVPPGEELPGWALPPGGGFWGGDGPLAGGAAAADWADHLPDFSLCLTAGASERDTLDDEPVTSQHIIDSITDVHPRLLLQQMWDIAAVRRAQLGATPEALAAARQPLGSGRLLFHHESYAAQERLAMQPADVEAVVELVCGKHTPGAASAVSGGAEDDAGADPAHWRRSQPLAQQPGSASIAGGSDGRAPLGQVAGCLLMKLLMDLWLVAGPEAALPLALRMLQAALQHDAVQVRARAFDVLYNLSLHSCMLTLGAPHQQQQQQHGGQHQQQQQQRQPRQASAATQQPAWRSGGGGGDARSSSHTGGSGGLKLEVPALQLQVGRSGSRSQGLASPRIHLPQQMLRPSSPRGGDTSPRGSSPRGLPPAAARHPSRLSASTAAALRGSSGGGGGPGAGRSTSGSGASAQLAAGGGAAAAGGGGGRGGGDAPLVSPQRSRHGGGGGGGGEVFGTQGGQALPLEAQLDQWLRQLLFELLRMLAQAGEASEPVWQSALGCLLHLTTHAGHWAAPALTALPPEALAALLRAALAFNWSQELHARLLQLAPHVLRAPPPPSLQPQQAPPAGGGSAAAERAAPRSGEATPRGADAGGAVEGAAARRGLLAVDAAALAAFGGPGELLRHFERAPSAVSRADTGCLLLLSLLPPGLPPATIATLLSVLCGSPAATHALQAAVRSHRPGLSDALLAAITRSFGADAADLQLLSGTLLQLEGLVLAGAPGQADGVAPVSARAVRERSSNGDGGGGSDGGEGGSSDGGGAMRLDDGAGAADEAGVWRSSHTWVAQAATLTLRHVSGDVSGQAPEVAAAWKALKELAWAREASAQAAVVEWLRQLLGRVLEVAAQGVIPLPLPGAPLYADPFSAPSCLADALQHLVCTCPRGSELLVSALQRHTLAALQEAAADGGAQPAPTTAAPRSAAAPRRRTLQAWALVVHWVLQGAPRLCRPALVRLAAAALDMACQRVDDSGSGGCGGDWLPVPVPVDDAAASDGGDGGGGGNEEDGAWVLQPGAMCDAQAFLMGRQAVCQCAADLLPGKSLAALVLRLLHGKAGSSSSAAARAVQGRPGGAGALAGSLPLVLAPWSDAGADLQLSSLLLLFVMCDAGDDNSYDGLVDELGQQVLLSGMDSRQCLLSCVLLLDRLMTRSQERYWQALRQLVVTAQGADDERLLANPFLQLGALLELQQLRLHGEHPAPPAAAGGHEAQGAPVGLAAA